MIKVIKDNKVYFTCLALYFFVGAILLSIWIKGDPEIYMNRRHHFFFDYFFRTMTLLGDGFFAFPLIVLVFLYNSIYRSIVIFSSVMLTFFVVQGLKLFVFAHMDRPFKYFPKKYNLYYIEGLEIHSSNSFPSGHSAQAFAIFLLLTIFVKDKRWSILFFALAFLTTISRMYLLQHFFMDTYFGALIATVVTFITYIYFTEYTSLSKKERWQRGYLS